MPPKEIFEWLLIVGVSQTVHKIYESSSTTINFASIAAVDVYLNSFEGIADLEVSSDFQRHV